ncbi:MAG: tyrosine-type recombinase/integrase [Candidatus Limivicinus sp.]
MANIKKIDGKTGVAYKITVTSGRNSDGKQIRHYLTWRPAPGMTERQIEKAVQKAAFEFEQKIEQGFIADNRQTFAQYAEYVVSLKERSGTKRRTVEWYRDLLPRINAAIGHLKLTDIRPQHLNMFYANMAEDGIRTAPVKATPKKDIASLMKAKKLSLSEIARSSNMAASTFSPAIHGKTVSKKTADALAAALGYKTEALFKLTQDTSPLSSRTILGYHRLISSVLSQAEKEMLIPYNPARRASPPKQDRAETDSFQPEELVRILACLENEPIKWRTITHLLIVTGCRRSEIMGLHWDAIDWKGQQLRIDRALLYTAESGIYEDTTKTGETRFIKVPAETMQLLKQYRAYYDGLRLKNGDRWIESDYVFTRDDGGVMNPDNITQWLGNFAKKYDLPPIHPHKFRHTMASLLIYNGTDVLTVSKRLGHAQVSTTTDIYSHAIKEADERAAESIADVILRRA